MPKDSISEIASQPELAEGVASVIEVYPEVGGLR
jgi:hypothetical protein